MPTPTPADFRAAATHAIELMTEVGETVGPIERAELDGCPGAWVTLKVWVPIADAELIRTARVPK